jgi:uncharacterized protein YerC
VSRMRRESYPQKARCGEQNGMARLTAEQVMKIMRDRRTQEIIAGHYGIDQCTVSDIRRGATWGWLTGLYGAANCRMKNQRA